MSVQPGKLESWKRWDALHSLGNALDHVPLAGSYRRRRRSAQMGEQVATQVVGNLQDSSGNTIYEPDHGMIGWKPAKAAAGFLHSTGFEATARWIDSAAGLSLSRADDLKAAEKNIASIEWERDPKTGKYVITNKGNYNAKLGKHRFADLLITDLRILEEALTKENGSGLVDAFDYFSPSSKNPKVLQVLAAVAFHDSDEVDLLHSVQEPRQKAKNILLQVFKAHAKKSGLTEGERLPAENFIRHFGHETAQKRTMAMLTLLNEVDPSQGGSKGYRKQILDKISDAKHSLGNDNVANLYASIISIELDDFLADPFSKRYLGHADFAYSDPENEAVASVLKKFQDVFTAALPKWKDFDAESQPMVKSFINLIKLVPGDTARDQHVEKIHTEIRDMYLVQKNLDREVKKLEEVFDAFSHSVATEDEVHMHVGYASKAQLDEYLTKLGKHGDFIASLTSPADNTRANALRFLRSVSNSPFIMVKATRTQMVDVENELKTARAAAETHTSKVRRTRLSIAHASKALPGLAKSLIESAAFKDLIDENGNAKIDDFFSDVDGETAFFKKTFESVLNDEIIKEVANKRHQITNLEILKAEKTKFETDMKDRFGQTLNGVVADADLADYYKAMLGSSYETNISPYIEEFNDATTSVSRKETLKGLMFARLVYHSSSNQMETKIYTKQNPVTRIIKKTREYYASINQPRSILHSTLGLPAAEFAFSATNANDFKAFCVNYGNMIKHGGTIKTKEDKIERIQEKIDAFKAKDINNDDYNSLAKRIDGFVLDTVKDIYHEYNAAFTDFTIAIAPQFPDLMTNIRKVLVNFVESLLTYLTPHPGFIDVIDNGSYRSKITKTLMEVADEFESTGWLV